MVPTKFIDQASFQLKATCQVIEDNFPKCLYIRQIRQIGARVCES